MGLALILYHNNEQFPNLWHFWELIYKCAESFVRRYSREKVQSWAKHIETFQVLAYLSLITAEAELCYYHHRSSVRVTPQVTARLKPYVLKKVPKLLGIKIGFLAIALKIKHFTEAPIPV